MKLQKLNFLKTGTDKYSMSYGDKFQNITMGPDELRKFLMKIDASDIDSLPRSKRFASYKSMANGISTGTCKHVYAPDHKIKDCIKEDTVKSRKLKEMNPMQGPQRGSSPSRNIRIVRYPMDTIEVGDTFIAKRDGQDFDKGDSIEIIGVQPVSIGRGNEFFVKVNGRPIRNPVISDLELVLGENRIREASSIVRKMAKDSGKSEKEVEKLWKQAVEITTETFGKKEKDFKAKEYAYATGILKNSMGVKEDIGKDFIESDLDAKNFISSEETQVSGSLGIDGDIKNKDKKKKVVEPDEKKEE